MTNLSSIEWAQIILAVGGGFLIVGTLTFSLLKLTGNLGFFNLKGMRKVAKSPGESRAVPETSYHPVPTTFHNVPKVMKMGATSAAKLQETVRMTINHTCTSSQRLLAAISRNVAPRSPSAEQI